jgi:hypothetical protein
MRYLDLAEVVALAAEVSEVEAGKLVELLRDYLVAVTRYPLLTPADELELAASIRTDTEVMAAESRRRLIEPTPAWSYQSPAPTRARACRRST